MGNFSKKNHRLLFIISTPKLTSCCLSDYNFYDYIVNASKLNVCAIILIPRVVFSWWGCSSSSWNLLRRHTANVSGCYSNNFQIHVLFFSFQWDLNHYSSGTLHLKRSENSKWVPILSNEAKIKLKKQFLLKNQILGQPPGLIKLWLTKFLPEPTFEWFDLILHEV